MPRLRLRHAAAMRHADALFALLLAVYFAAPLMPHDMLIFRRHAIIRHLLL